MTNEMNVFGGREIIITDEERLIKKAQGYDTGFVLDGKKIWFNSEKLRERKSIDEFIDKLNKISTKPVKCIDHSSHGSIGVIVGDELVFTTSCSGLFSCETLDKIKINGNAIRNEDSFAEMFYHCRHLSSIDVSKLDTGSGENFSKMFSGCSSLKELDVSGFEIMDNKPGICLNCLFENCEELRDVRLFNLKGICSIEGMFYNCVSLSELDLSNWDVSKVYIMDGMFDGCVNLEKINFSNWELDPSTDVTAMDIFNHCYGLKEVVLTGCNAYTKEFIKTNVIKCKQESRRGLGLFKSQDACEMVEDVQFVE